MLPRDVSTTLRGRAVIASCAAVWIAVGVACVGPAPNSSTCESFGGSCLTQSGPHASQTQCGETLPYSCTSGVCCLPLPSSGISPAPTTTTTSTATSPTGTSTSTPPPTDAGGGVDSTTGMDSTTNPVDSGTSAMDSTMAAMDSSPAADSGVADTEMPDTNLPDTNLPDTNVADSNVPDTNVPDTSSAVPTTCAQADMAFGCCAVGVLYYCVGSVTSMTCTGNTVCGWSATKNYYDCVAPPGGADPSGTYPIACQ
jgi:hypothetical protein